MSNSGDSDDAYSVGYKRPPLATRFKKGKSGNPKGRPKHKTSVAAILRDTLFKPVRVRDADRVRSIPKIEAIIEVNVNKALKGDLRTFAKIMEMANKLGIADTFVSEQEKAEIKKAREEAFQQIGALLDEAARQRLEAHKNETTDLVNR